MSSNFKHPGQVLSGISVPAGGVTSGLGYLIGALFVIALQTVAYASTATFDGAVSGAWELAKVSAQAWAQGDRIYWDAANAQATTVRAGNHFIGHAEDVAANPSSTGVVRLNGVTSPLADIGVPVSINTAGPVTLTAAQILSGLIVRDTNGAGRTDTLPTAALLVAAIAGAKVGDIVRCRIINGADAAETLTIAAGTGGAFDANQQASSQVIGQNASKELVIRLTNVTSGTEAYAVYL